MTEERLQRLERAIILIAKQIEQIAWDITLDEGNDDLQRSYYSDHYEELSELSKITDQLVNEITSR